MEHTPPGHAARPCPGPFQDREIPYTMAMQKPHPASRTGTGTGKILGPSRPMATLLAALLFLAGCAPKPPSVTPSKPQLTRVSWDALAGAEDDLQLEGLEEALARSLSYFERGGREISFEVEGRKVSADGIRRTLLSLREMLERGELRLPALSRNFDLYAYPRQAHSGGNVLVTGYYEPVLEARLEPDHVFRYPLYSPPPDLIQVALEEFPWLSAPETGPRRVLGRIEGNRLVPYFDRRQIDGQGALQGRGLELAWLKDPVDAFILHVQGSGVLRLSDGTTRRVGYAAGNGRPYRSIGAYAIARGWIPREEMSLQTLRRFLKDHPERLQEILWHNPSYVFFRWVEEGPLGSLHVPLTPGRSIAADSAWYPDGVPAVLTGRLPLGDGTHRTRPFQRWVVHQDSGGAIRGPHRVDLYCGTGDAAEAVAGRLKHPGNLYIVLKKIDEPADVLE